MIFFLFNNDLRNEECIIYIFINTNNHSDKDVSFGTITPNRIIAVHSVIVCKACPGVFTVHD